VLREDPALPQFFEFRIGRLAEPRLLGASAQRRFDARNAEPAIWIQRGPWNEELVSERFPDLAHEDEVDACSGALEMLNPPMKSWGSFELARQRAQQINQATKSKPTSPNWAIGSIEWQAEQDKAGVKNGA
jgi:hypothetical protein